MTQQPSEGMGGQIAPGSPNVELLVQKLAEAEARGRTQGRLESAAERQGLQAALRLIAQRAQVATAVDAEEALSWIYWHATEATNAR